MAFHHILVLRPGQFCRLDSALTKGQPDSAGLVQLCQPVPWPEGPTSTVPVQLCYLYNRELMQSVNSLVDTARDALGAATNEIIAQAEAAYTATGTTPEITH